MTIQPIVVAIFALTAAISLWDMRAMPWLSRVSVMIPRLYLAIIYFYPFDPVGGRMPYLRAGLLAMFFIETVVSGVMMWHRRKTIWQLKA